jgi:hypothetical protein
MLTLCLSFQTLLRLQRKQQEVCLSLIAQILELRLPAFQEVFFKLRLLFYIPFRMMRPGAFSFSSRFNEEDRIKNYLKQLFRLLILLPVVCH